MTCDYFAYRDMTENMFFGVALTDQHMNNATENIRKYLVDGGATEVLNDLSIGLQIMKRQNEVLRRRFVYIAGNRKGEELTINEIMNIGMFLKHGAYYGRKLT